MNQILLDIRKDACRQLKSAKKADIEILLEAEVNILKLAVTAQQKGYAMLQNVVLPFGLDYLEMLVSFIIEGNGEDDIAELGANEYWTREPQGVQAMADYFSLRGILCILENTHPRLIEKAFSVLVPAEWREDYRSRLEKAEALMPGWRSGTDRELAEEFYSICPEFKSAELTEKLRELEEVFIQGMDDRSIERAVRGNGSSYEWGGCIYGLNKDARKKILANVSEELAWRIMDDMICFSRRDGDKEKAVYKSAQMMYDIIIRLEEDGELVISTGRKVFEL